VDKKQLESRLETIEEERKWLKRAIKVIKDGEKFQTKPQSTGSPIPTASKGSGSQKGL
jgi:hypothetical protein